MPPFGTIPAKTRSFKQDFLPALIMGTMQGAKQRTQEDYERKVLMDILSGKPPTEALTPNRGGGITGFLGGQPSASNLSPFTANLLGMLAKQKLRDPLETRGMIADVEGRETQTEGMREDIAASREARPLKLQNLRQEIAAREKEIAFIEETNPERAKALRGQNAQIEQQLDESRKKLPLEMQSMALALDIAKENLTQSKDIAPLQKQHLQAQINQATAAIETGKKMTPLDIQQAKAMIEQIKANIGQIKANTEYIQGGKGKGTEPLSFNELKSASDIADKVLITAKRGWVGSIGRYDYPKEALKKAYQSFIIYSAPQTQSQLDQLKALWKSRMAGNEFEWDDKDFETAQGTGRGQQARTPPKDYPDAVWDEQRKMFTVVRNGRLMGVK